MFASLFHRVDLSCFFSKNKIVGGGGGEGGGGGGEGWGEGVVVHPRSLQIGGRGLCCGNYSTLRVKYS